MILDIADYCTNSSIMLLVKILKNIINMIHMIVPILLMISITIKLSKMIMSNMDDKTVSKIKKNIINSLIATIVIFFIPSLVNTTMNLLDNNNISFGICWNNVDNGSFSNSTFIDPNEKEKKSFTNNPDEYESGENKSSSNRNSNNKTDNNSTNKTKNNIDDIDGVEVTYRKAVGTGQGMERIKATDGNYYFMAAIYKKGHKTLLTIYDDNGNIVSEIQDYDFNKAGSITANDSYIFINKQGNRNTELRISYILDAIQKYKENGNKIITSGFTKNYIVGEAKTPNYYSSITYDRERNKLYGSNCGRITEIKMEQNKRIMKSGETAKMGKSNKYTVSSQHNSGIAISGDYLFAGRFFEKPRRNVLDIYKCSFDSNGAIHSIKHIKRITFTDKSMKEGEIEDISASNNYLYIYNHRNSNYGKRENIYRYSISSLVS